MKSVLVVLMSLLPLAGLGREVSLAKEWVYIGTYTGRGSKGIYVAEFDPATGRVGEAKLAAKAENPSFVALHPSHRYLYAVNEVGVFQGKPVGSVTAFSINPQSGLLTPINSQSSGGAGPCHLSLDKAGRAVFVANYGGGSVASLPVHDDGGLGEPTVVKHHGSGPDKGRQEQPHAHSINVTPDDGYAVAADLGLDAAISYRLDEQRRLMPGPTGGVGRVPPGSGPRHFAFHPNARFGYVNNEMSATVTAFRYDGRGGLASLETLSTLPKDFTGPRGTAEIQILPSGRFLYVSNRGHNSLAVFHIGEDGKLTATGYVPTGGKTPRNFCIHPNGRFLLAANQDSDSLVVFRIDPATGLPQPTEQRINVPMPVCVRFLQR